MTNGLHRKRRRILIEMPEPDTRFRTYLRAFTADMFSRMSGPASVPFAALAVLVSSHWQKVVYGCLAATCTVYSSYRVWRNERRDVSTRIVDAITSAKNEEIKVLNQRLAELSRTTQRAPPEPPSNIQRGLITEALLAGTGMRIGEACGLRVEDLDLDNQVIYVNRSFSETANRCPRKRIIPFGRSTSTQVCAKHCANTLGKGSRVWCFRRRTDLQCVRGTSSSAS